MITPLLKSALEPIVKRQRLAKRLLLIALSLIAFAGISVLVQMAGYRIHSVRFFIWAFFVARIAMWVADRWKPDYAAIAKAIEEKDPALNEVLTTAIEQVPEPATGKLHFLQLRVVAEAIAKAQNERWLLAAVSAKQMASCWAGVTAALIICGIVANLDIRSPRHSKAVAKAGVLVTGDLEVTPGDATIERGQSLVILARFNPAQVPGAASLIVSAPGEAPRTIPLAKNFNDPVFGGGLPEVRTDLTYRIDYAGQSTKEFKINVFDYPRLERADATMRFPAYTKLEEKKLPDTHRVGAVEGTKLAVDFELNKPVRSAALVARDGTSIALNVEPGAARVTLREFDVRKTQTYELKLVDADGRANKIPEQFKIEALANRRPELKFITPKGDQRVSPLEEVAFRGQAWDDFGLSRYGVAINVAGRGETEIELGKDTQPDERRDLAHLMKLEEVGVKPDELVSWYLWADDIGPDGKPRRTATDMFFGEVRPFEEIFRAGDVDQEEPQEQQQQQQAGGAQAEKAEKLAELQKQIINATWKLQRSVEPEAKPDEKYRADQTVVRDSQAAAIEQIKALVEKAESPRTKALAEDANTAMQGALEKLNAASDDAKPLPGAVAGEQGAYNALLKLAAHEFNVQKNKKQQKGKGQAQQKQQQQQLDELEMKEEKKRYETQREAAPPQQEAQKAELAILNRLKELAQRQQDINERLKEFQNALDAAKTETEKEEIRRQLKRLREEEQQMVADLDEARQKMEQAPQQAELAEDRKQLDKTRGEAQKAAEAMQQNAASQALANGTRAAQDLQKMKEDFRKKTSGQFSEGMREMRNDARELARNQEELAEKLKAPEPSKNERRTLAGDSDREQLAQKFEKQQGDLKGITDKMKEVSEQAEAAEPLLARELYDTLRKTAQANTGQTLELTQRLAERGATTQAQTFEQKARKEIDELKSGVERAAESVLGDEAEALRTARAEVDALAKAVGGGKDEGSMTKDSAAGREDGAAGEKTDAQKAKDGAHGGQEKAQGEQTPGKGAQGQGDGAPGKTPGDKGQGSGDKGQGSGDKGQGSEGQSGQLAQEGQPKGAQNPGEARGGAQTKLQKGGAPNGGSDKGGLGSGATGGEQAGPISGENFGEWSDRLRNVEEMIDDPKLRAKAAQIRESAKVLRAEVKRHSVEPNWEIVRSKVTAPLAELRDRLSEELAKRESKENLVPIDRDPVPTKYAERVRVYYEELGKSR